MGIDEGSDEASEKEEIIYPSVNPLFKKHFPFDIIALNCGENHSTLVLEHNMN